MKEWMNTFIQVSNWNSSKESLNGDTINKLKLKVNSYTFLIKIDNTVYNW